MRRRSPAILASPFFLPLSSARSGSPYGLIASESESYKILHLYLMHVNAIRFDVQAAGRVDPEKRTDAISTRTGSLRSNASRAPAGLSRRRAPGAAPDLVAQAAQLHATESMAVRLHPHHEAETPAPGAQEEEVRMRKRLAPETGSD
jgi:hypothetical protein